MYSIAYTGAFFSVCLYYTNLNFSSKHMPTINSSIHNLQY